MWQGTHPAGGRAGLLEASLYSDRDGGPACAGCDESIRRRVFLMRRCYTWRSEKARLLTNFVPAK